MSANKDEAARCLDLSRSRLHAGNRAAALKLARKSIALHETQAGRDWLESLLANDDTNNTNTSSSTTGGNGSGRGPSPRRKQSPQPQTHSRTTPSAAAGSTQPSHTHTQRTAAGRAAAASAAAAASEAESETSSRSYTPEQAATVTRVIESRTDYYAVLGLSRDCADGDIKRAYRRLALQVHPDKCAAPRTDEAFKIIAQAFDKLSNPDSRAYYDRHGADDSRAAQARHASASQFSDLFGGGGGGAPGHVFETNIDPDLIFNMFFNGGFSGAGMGGGMGDSGFRFQSFSARPGFHRPRRQGATDPRFRQYAQQGDNPNMTRIAQFLQLLPLIIIGFTLVSTIIGNLFAEVPAPDVKFHRTRTYNQQMTTPGKHVDYFVSKSAWEEWPGSKKPEKVLQFNREVDEHYGYVLRNGCEMERRQQVSMEQRARGFFFTDEDMLSQARNLPMPNCKAYNEFMLRPSS